MTMLRIVHSWTSRAEMLEGTGREDVQLTLGCESEYVVAWQLARVLDVAVLLCTDDSSAAAQAVEPRPDGPVIVGLNRDLYAVDTSARTLRHAVDFWTPFYEFVDASPTGATALFETGLARVSADGDVLWRLDTDLIGNYRRDGRVIRLQLFDAGTASFDVESGDPVDAQ